MRLKAIDICAGAGGWAIAARGLPINIIAAIDWDEDCCATYSYNHPNIKVIKDNVLSHNFEQYKGIDIFLGSIPCEEISVARQNKPTTNKQMEKWHTLLDTVLDAVEITEPKYWCLENVQQMKKHLPPLTPYMILDSSQWCAQKRKRIFVGQFPLPKNSENGDVNLKDCLLPGPYTIKKRTLTCTKISRRQWYTNGYKRVLDTQSKAPTITDFGSRHSRGFCITMPDGRERALQFTEAAKLQGFPDDYVFVSSLTRAWKMVAQAIQINLGRAILEAIVKHSERANEKEKA